MAMLSQLTTSSQKLKEGRLSIYVSATVGRGRGAVVVHTAIERDHSHGCLDQHANSVTFLHDEDRLCSSESATVCPLSA